MLRTLRTQLALVLASSAALVSGGHLAAADSSPVPAPTGAPPAAPAEGADAAGPDEAHLRELVDREVARVLAERAAKDAAEQAAREAAEAKDGRGGKDGAPAKASDVTGADGFVDTRLSFTLTNENLLVKPGETIPSVPGWRFGRPNSLGVLFFENYDTRYSGYETLSHAVLYREYSAEHLQAEAGFVLRINELSEKQIDLSDDGSYIKLSHWKDPAHKDPTRLSLTAFPVSSDRFRLGYSWRLSWGGSPEYGRAKSAVPGVKVQWENALGYAFVGAKSAVVLDRATAEEKSALAVLAGAGVDPSDMLRLEVNGGYYDRGNNELQDVNTEKVQLYGASFQAALHHGMPVSSSLDYKLYKNSNEQIGKLFNKVKYPGGVSWLAMTEFTVLSQTLKDPEKTGSTKLQTGKAGDVNVRVMADRTRLSLDLSFRDLAFILHSQPSLPTYQDFPKEYATSPNFFAAVGADQNWGDWLTLGLSVGVEKPATLTSPKGIPGGATGVSGESTAVIRNNGTSTLITILPVGKDAAPQIATKFSGRIDFAKMYAAILDVYYSYDPNVTRYTRGSINDAFSYEFGEFNQLGVNATLQAKF